MRILFLLVSFALLLGIAGCTATDVNHLAGNAYTGDPYPEFSSY